MEPPKKALKLDKVTHDVVTAEEITEKDLPLLANVDDVRVRHYLMKLKTNFKEKVITASSILFLEWTKSGDHLTSPQKIVFDACHLNIKQVCSIKTAKEYDVSSKFDSLTYTESGVKGFYGSDENWLSRKKSSSGSEKLKFTVEKWSVTIFGWTDTPSVIQIDYETQPNSASLDWRSCHGYKYNSNDVENICVYTPAMPINNRGLFPCQEPPSALATWEVLIETDNRLTPLLTSDEPGKIVETGETTSTHYFYTSVPLPMANFALVIGHFFLQTDLKASNELKKTDEDDYCGIDLFLPSSCNNHKPYPCRFSDLEVCQQALIPVRLFSLDEACIASLKIEKLMEFINISLKACHENIGPHPFSRLDFVIMPFCYPHMGLASPSMIFLSPSNFTNCSDNNEPLFVSRIPHEICHSWFGLLIGALDWTEEWLSEGFATYCEDIVFLQTYQSYFPQVTRSKVLKEHVLKICLRFIMLHHELRNTDNELQVMSREAEDKKTAKNGLDPIKQFLNIHYYKGYLLLWHLASLVGQERFLGFLKEYVWTYHAQLVNSEIFLQFYYEKFKNELATNEKFTSIEMIKKVWLESSKLPEPFDTLDLLGMNEESWDSCSIPVLFEGARNSLQAIVNIFEQLKQKKYEVEDLDQLSSTELMILQELLSKEMNENKKVGNQIYNQLVKSRIFKVKQQNPDIVHRWCELIVLKGDEKRLKIVENFLERHVAMGVYLYGELMISRKSTFQKVAKKLHKKLEGVYDLGTRRILKEMLFPQKDN